MRIGQRLATRGGEECDVTSRWRRYFKYLQRPGVVSAVKRRMRRRERRDRRNDITGSARGER